MGGEREKEREGEGEPLIILGFVQVLSRQGDYLGAASIVLIKVVLLPYERHIYSSTSHSTKAAKRLVSLSWLSYACVCVCGMRMYKSVSASVSDWV